MIERELARREKTKHRVAALMRAAEAATGFTFAAGFCLSEEDDQLSQWRGYADDGHGFAIGFREEYLRRLGEKYRDESPPGLKLQKIRYDEEEYRGDLEAILVNVETALDRGALRFVSLLEAASEDREQIQTAYDGATASLYMSFTPLMSLCHSVKNPAFREEKEWRLMSILLKVRDVKLSVEELCEFKNARDRIVPYRSIQLHKLEPDAIEAIVLGPRNITREDYLRALLAKHDFVDVEIRRSTASYR